MAYHVNRHARLGPWVLINERWYYPIMRWSRANLEEKQEPRAATSASAERHAEGICHDVTTKGLTEAAIEKRTLPLATPVNAPMT